MDTRVLALIMLCGHIISVGAIVLVLAKQIRIVHQAPDPSLRAGRVVLFVLAVAILFGNFIPITIDSLVLVGRVVRNSPSPVGVVYALSNVATLMLSSAAVLALYIIAARLLKDGE